MDNIEYLDEIEELINMIDTLKQINREDLEDYFSLLF